MSPSRLRRNQRRERRAIARVAIRPKFSADILSAWDHARWVWNTFCHLLFHTPQELALREVVSRREARDFHDWLRGMEVLARRIIFAAALAMTIVLKPHASRPVRPRKRRRVLIWPQKPHTWIARLPMLPHRSSNGSHASTTTRPLPALVPSFPLARRLEAIRRVLAKPEPCARRLAVKLARIAERNARADRPRRFAVRAWPPRRILTRCEHMVLSAMKTLEPLIQDGLGRWNQRFEPG